MVFSGVDLVVITFVFCVIRDLKAQHNCWRRLNNLTSLGFRPFVWMARKRYRLYYKRRKKIQTQDCTVVRIIKEWIVIVHNYFFQTQVFLVSMWLLWQHFLVFSSGQGMKKHIVGQTCWKIDACCWVWLRAVLIFYELRRVVQYKLKKLAHDRYDRAGTCWSVDVCLTGSIRAGTMLWNKCSTLAKWHLCGSVSFVWIYHYLDILNEYAPYYSEQER